jgi:hypothetical protein
MEFKVADPLCWHLNSSQHFCIYCHFNTMEITESSICNWIPAFIPVLKNWFCLLSMTLIIISKTHDKDMNSQQNLQQ